MAAGTVIELITQIAGAVSAVAAATALLIKPIRARIFGLSATQDGLRCVLRFEMLRIYYQRREEKKSVNMRRKTSFMRIMLIKSLVETASLT